MSRQGMIIAHQFATDLPSFANLAEARQSLFAARDAGLADLLAVVELQGKLDYTPNSLNLLEQWFFASGQPTALPSGYSTAHAIGFYLGEVYCRYGGFAWTVQEYVFSPGRYEIGVSRTSMSLMLTKGKLLRATGNKRMRSLSREFNKYATQPKC